MRPLNETEESIVSALQQRGKLNADIPMDHFRTSYTKVDTYTVATVEVEGVTRIGVSKYNLHDAKTGHVFTPELGQRIAFARAFHEQEVQI